MAQEEKTRSVPQQSGKSAQGNGSSQEVVPSATEMAAAAAVAGEVQTRATQDMQTFVQWLIDRAETKDEDQFALMASIVSEIMASESIADAMAEKSAMHARDMVNVPLIMHGFEIREGEFEDSMTGHYAAITVSRPGSDVTRVVTCGATKVLAKLFVLDKFGEWPQPFYFTEKKTSKGFGVLDIIQPQL